MPPRYHLRCRGRRANTLRPNRLRSEARTFARVRRDVSARASHHVAARPATLFRPRAARPPSQANSRRKSPLEYCAFSPRLFTLRRSHASLHAESAVKSNHAELHPNCFDDHDLITGRVPDELHISFIHAIDG